jgi:hypothetical protein
MIDLPGLNMYMTLSGWSMRSAMGWNSLAGGVHHIIPFLPSRDSKSAPVMCLSSKSGT